ANGSRAPTARSRTWPAAARRRSPPRSCRSRWCRAGPARRPRCCSSSRRGSPPGSRPTSCRARSRASGARPRPCPPARDARAVAGGMEGEGVRVDEKRLVALSREYDRELAAIAGRIEALAGEPFQVNSPKQLGQILFERLKLPVVKKTKTGYSTDEDVLEQL